MKSVIFTAHAARDLDSLVPADRSRVEKALYDYAVSGKGDVKTLTGRSEFRLRAGDLRVIFAEDRATILAIYIGRRQTATYRRH